MAEQGERRKEKEEEDKKAKKEVGEKRMYRMRSGMFNSLEKCKKIGEVVQVLPKQLLFGKQVLKDKNSKDKNKES